MMAGKEKDYLDFETDDFTIAYNQDSLAIRGKGKKAKGTLRIDKSLISKLANLLKETKGIM